MLPPTILAALVDLSGPQHNVHWGRFLISLANLTVIAVMVVIFVLAIFLPSPGHARRPRKRAP